MLKAIRKIKRSITFNNDTSSKKRKRTIGKKIFVEYLFEIFQPKNQNDVIIIPDELQNETSVTSKEIAKKKKQKQYKL